MITGNSKYSCAMSFVCDIELFISEFGPFQKHLKNLMIRKFRTFSVIMSKNKKTQKKDESQPIIGVPKNQPIQMDKQGNILIKILAKPGAKQNSITDISEDGIGVQISAPPVEGEANTELVKYLSSVLGLRKSDITLDKGSKSRQKTILVYKGIITVDLVKSMLQKECGNS